jgi:cell division septation protein DedD
LFAQGKRSSDFDPESDSQSPEFRLPNGKRQTDEILKADFEQNVKDARDLTNLAKALEDDLEKNEAFVISLASLKKLDDIEKLTRRIRGRMKRL